MTTRDGRSTRWDAHRAERRTRILNTAIDLIDSGTGWDTASLCAAVPIARSALYRIFPDQRILENLIREAIVARLIQAVPTSVADGDTARSLVERSVDEYVDWVVRHPSLQRYLSGTGTRSGLAVSAPVAAGRSAFVCMVSTKVAAALHLSAPPDSPAYVAVQRGAHGIVGLLESTVIDFHLTRDRPPTTDESLNAFLSAAVLGVIGAIADIAAVPFDPDSLIDTEAGKLP
ncbi:putative TetR family transcriptional regulator [Gordonia hirsuta DSM 44140 = NBRC 16056]|uniref:Putative TetR family transcriptional regulator n=1 Tax=Gordonia hirsuta DSM 44140 = NBRC 16056 TaxID=1121927 RepID=L7L9W1_9ACTN|nr:TetR/AcrR family transcriptional regulator [Gordonia hirsuta]GAC57516.1 putative TetR family transcriptional regulator [Gordonia hirsuta DSM 44140 = NBRC 16056]